MARRSVREAVALAAPRRGAAREGHKDIGAVLHGAPRAAAGFAAGDGKPRQSRSAWPCRRDAGPHVRDRHGSAADHSVKSGRISPEDTAAVGAMIAP